MSVPLLKVISSGAGITVQDAGRFGYRHRGLPRSGPMDPHAARIANRLAGNPPGAAVLELAMGGAVLEVVTSTWVAITGAAPSGPRVSAPTWSATWCTEGTRLEVGYARDAVWSYVAMPGGFDSPLQFGSRSSLLRAGIGIRFAAGDIIEGASGSHAVPASTGLARRWVPLGDRCDYSTRRALRVWWGPEADEFGQETRKKLFSTRWVVRSDSDRVGYRLEGGVMLKLRNPLELTSEPMLPGTIQVPPSGEPIVVMPDGPTMGGYPRLGIVDPQDLPLLAQSPAGGHVEFVSAE